jgi:hypothetical protein
MMQAFMALLLKLVAQIELAEARVLYIAQGAKKRWTRFVPNGQAFVE